MNQDSRFHVASTNELRVGRGSSVPNAKLPTPKSKSSADARVKLSEDTHLNSLLTSVV